MGGSEVHHPLHAIVCPRTTRLPAWTISTSSRSWALRGTSLLGFEPGADAIHVGALVAFGAAMWWPAGVSMQRRLVG